jgi:pyruvate,water dikinase
MALRALDDDDDRCGGKALGLRQLRRAGLPVPDGVVLDDDAFHAIVGAVGDVAADELGHALAAAAARLAEAPLPAALIAEVDAAAARLGELAVRSSASLEDGAAGAAAGVFSSRRAVPPAAVWDAIRAVWQSALTPLAAAYGRRRGAASRGPLGTFGVILQRFVHGEDVTIYTRPPGSPTRDEVWVQRGGALRRTGRDDPSPLVALALRAEAAIGATGGADVELCVAKDQAWVVQARPVVHAQAAPRRLAPPPLTAALVADGRRWTWDVAHNPDPLSPAQIGLVERIERASAAPWAMRVCSGYLYTTPLASPPVAPPRSADELASRAAAIEAALAADLGLVGDVDALGEPPPLAEALARYVAAYRRWACELGPLIAVARRALPDALRRRGLAAPALEREVAARLGPRPSAVEATLAAAARGELDLAAVTARLGPLAPSWDVADATFGERPGLLADAIARAAASPPPPRASTDDVGDDLAAEVRLARFAADLAERDDAWFARAQHLVRRALHARAAALGIDRADVCWLPLEEVTAAATLDRDDAHRRAAAARAAAARAAQWEMPLVVGGDGREGAAAPPGLALRGHGTGGRATGRVVRFASLAAAIAPGRGDVVVTRAVTPALAVLVVGCAALVSETGGLLDHGAAMARELGTPCVVGCVGAWRDLAEGALVTVDADAGEVYSSSSL